MIVHKFFCDLLAVRRYWVSISWAQWPYLTALYSVFLQYTMTFLVRHVLNCTRETLHGAEGKPFPLSSPHAHDQSCDKHQRRCWLHSLHHTQPGRCCVGDKACACEGRQSSWSSNVRRACRALEACTWKRRPVEKRVWKRRGRDPGAETCSFATSASFSLQGPPLVVRCPPCHAGQTACDTDRLRSGHTGKAFSGHIQSLRGQTPWRCDSCLQASQALSPAVALVCA